MDSANRSTAHNIATGGTGYFFQIDIFTTIRMVLKRVKNVHSNGILIIISSFFIRSIRQHKAVLLNVWNSMTALRKTVPV